MAHAVKVLNTNNNLLNLQRWIIFVVVVQHEQLKVNYEYILNILDITMLNKVLYTITHQDKYLQD